MTISEFLTSCGVENTSKLAEYLQKEYFWNGQTPRHEEWQNCSAQVAKVFGEYSVVIIKKSWWSRGSGIGRSNFIVAVNESTGQIYSSPDIDYRDQYSERKDRPWNDFHEIRSLVPKEDRNLVAEVADWDEHTQQISLKGGD